MKALALERERSGDLFFNNDKAKPIEKKKKIIKLS